MPMSLRSPTPTPALLTPKSLPMPTPRARSPVPPTRTIKSLPINTSTTLPVVPLQSRRHSTPKIPTLKHRGWGTLATLHPNEVQQWYPLFAWRRQEKTKTSAWATLYDGVGSVKGHVEFTSREGLFFSSPKRNSSLSFISTKARFVNRAVETGSTNHLFDHPPKGDHDSFFRRRDRSREQGAQSA